MNSDNNSNGIPNLRFPGFTGGWEEKKLGEVANINPRTESIPNQFIYIDLESVSSGVLLKRNLIEKVDAPSRAKRILTDGDILFQTVRPYQRNNYHFHKKDDYEYVASTGYAQIQYPECSEYLYQLLYADSFVESVMKKCVGGNYPAINSSDLGEITVPVPPTIAEQKKIAECLSTVDELIEAQGLMVDALKERKRGLMQQLFPLPGETTPRLRFPSFTGEWEEKEFGKLIQESKLSSKEENEDVLLTSAIDGMFLNSERFSHQRGKSTIGYRKIKKGMLILSAQNLHLGNANVNLRFDSGLVSPAYKVYTIVGCLPEFMAQWIKRDATKEFFLRATTQGASECRKNVVWEQLYKQTIPVPNNDAEQRIIADFLFQMDAQIVAQSQKLESLQAHKRGLMQQLFPNPNK